MRLKVPLPGRADALGAGWGEVWVSCTGHSAATGITQGRDAVPWLGDPVEHPPMGAAPIYTRQPSPAMSPSPSQRSPTRAFWQQLIPRDSSAAPPFRGTSPLPSCSCPHLQQRLSCIHLLLSRVQHDNRLPSPCHSSHPWRPAPHTPSRSQGGTAGTASCPGTPAALVLQQRSPTAAQPVPGAALHRDPAGDTADARARWWDTRCSGALERSPRWWHLPTPPHISLCLLPLGPARESAG